jgi:hypothetical protein
MLERETRPGGAGDEAMRGDCRRCRSRTQQGTGDERWESPGSGWWVGEPQLWAGWASRIRGEVSWMPLGIGFFGLRDAIGDWAW